MKEKMEGERVASPAGVVVGEGTQEIVRSAAIPPDRLDDVNGNPTDPDTQLQVRTRVTPAVCVAGISHWRVSARHIKMPGHCCITNESW